ncbi:MAG: DUF72 domain-containing protein [Rhizomicrobium sp.]|jgi:uncharacterized protein YecE (DUF72 family)
MIRAGIGGWTFEPWRGGNFFPKGHAKTRELEFASRKVTSIEINGTYYSSQKPTSFKRWHDETPEDFLFAVKAIRFATNRRVLAEAGESVTRFVESGLSELKNKLGPILWQFMPTKKFDAADFGEFLSLLPEKLGSRKLRHAVEVRHESFLVPEFVALARKYGVAIVLADSAKYPMIADVTADFIYVRLQNAQAKVATGYALAAIDKWVKRAQTWQAGAGATDLPTLGKPAAKKKRDVFVYMINGAKERAPAAAMAFLQKLK